MTVEEAKSVLDGVFSDADQDKSMTAEDYARAAQVSPDVFGDELAERLAELSPDQACMLFDLARIGMEQAGSETVICAAIRLPDGRVIRGHRHGDCIRTAQELVYWQHSPRSGVGGPAWDVSMAQDQGFVTSRNRYVGREEALQLQLAAGIPSACSSGYRKSDLFSEDLY